VIPVDDLQSSLNGVLNFKSRAARSDHGSDAGEKKVLFKRMSFQVNDLKNPRDARSKMLESDR
jgi:hypothetical protein